MVNWWRQIVRLQAKGQLQENGGFGMGGKVLRKIGASEGIRILDIHAGIDGVKSRATEQ